MLVRDNTWNNFISWTTLALKSIAGFWEVKAGKENDPLGAITFHKTLLATGSWEWVG